MLAEGEGWLAAGHASLCCGDSTLPPPRVDVARAHCLQAASRGHCFLPSASNEVRGSATVAFPLFGGALTT